MHRLFSVALTVVMIVTLLAPLATTSGTADAAECSFQLGFQVLHDAMPETVGECMADQHYNPLNGDALQETTNGLLVWRKADNFTAFTDGYRSWVNGPYGIEERLNTERFEWEPPDPQAINLTLADMAPGFVAIDEFSRFQYNEEVLRDAKDPATMSRWLQDSGRLYGYISAFMQPTPAGRAGAFLVASDVDLFGNADGAHRAFEDYDVVVAEQGLVSSPVPAPAIGEESRAFEMQVTRNEDGEEVSFTFYYLVFRKGTIVAGVSTFGLTGEVDFNDNVHYARILESRIR